MKIIICGSRTMEISYRDFVSKTLVDIISKIQYDKETPNKELEIISGNNSKGADWLAERWAEENKLSLRLFPAEWNNEKPKKPDNWGNTPVCIWKPNYYGGYNSLAGYLRNQEMANEAIGGVCIAFDAEEKKGSTETRDMIKRAKKAWMIVYQIKCFDLDNVKVKIHNDWLVKKDV